MDLQNGKQYRWPPFWLTCGVVVLVLICLIAVIPDPADRPLTQERSIEIVRKAGGFPKEAEAVSFLKDYDMDGRPEAYVEIGQKEEDLIDGDLWFVSCDGYPRKLKEQILMKTEQEYFEQEKEVFLLVTYIDGNPLLTDVYGVSGGNCGQIEFPGTEEKYVQNGDLLCVSSDYDMDYDIEMEIFTGHTQKAYPCYYEDGGFREYESRALTREEVTAYENGSEILTAIESARMDGCCEFEYLLWENGMLNINRAEIYEDFIHFAYTTCQVEENRLALVSEGDGCYRRHFYEETEEVPEEERESFAERVAREYSEGSSVIW